MRRPDQPPTRRVPAWIEPAGLLACFSIDGCSTLIWNRIVRMQYPHLLTRPGFIMAQLTLNKPIPRRHLTPEFAPAHADNEVNILTKP